MKNSNQTGNNDTDSGEGQGQGNEGNSGSQGFLGGITDAISGIFNTANNATRSASEQANTANTTTNDAPMGGIPGLISGVSDAVNNATRSTSGQSSGTWPDQTGADSGSGVDATRESGGAVSTDDTGDNIGVDAGSTGYEEEEPFVGSGGVGSAEYYENLRRAHEAEGGEYTSDLGDPNRA
jgi:hypothetical protein